MENEAELLVVAGDGKGVVMRKTLAERLREERQAAAEENATVAAGGPSATADSQQESVLVPSPKVIRREGESSGEGPHRAKRKDRRRRGTRSHRGRRRGGKKRSPKESSQASAEKTKKSRKQMAYVGAVYTIARFERTPEQILNEVARRGRAKDRPRPQNKHVWGEMTQLAKGELLDGRSSLFLHLAVECHMRDPSRQKTLICLMDGEEPLWSAKEEWLDHAVEILDYFHVSEHLWKIWRSLPESRRPADFVEHHARMILEGKVLFGV